MPWSASDAPKHNAKTKGRPNLAKAWAKAANSALADGNDDGKAIATANKTVSQMIAKKKGRMRPQDFIAAFGRTQQEDIEALELAEGEDIDPEAEPDPAATSAADDDGRRMSGITTRDALDVISRDMLMDITPKSYDPATRTADAIISVGARVRRRDWDTEYDEVLDMNPRAIRLDRINAGGQLLDGHRFWGGLDAILGAVVPGTARVENGKLKARFKFSRSEGGERIAQDLADGLTLPLSTGYKTHREVRDATTTPETRTAVDWEPFEVSIVPVAAEGGETGFRSLHLHPGYARQTEDVAMNTRQQPGTSGPGGGSHDDRDREAREREEQIRKDERARIEREQREAEDKRKREADEKAARDKEVKERAEALVAEQNEIRGMVRAVGLDAKIAEDAIKEGKTPDQVRKIVFDKLAEAGEAGPRGNAQGNDPPALRGHFDPISMRVGQDRADIGRAEAMAEAIAIRVLQSRRDVPGVVTAEQAEWVKRMGRVDEVARSCRVYDGHEKPIHERTREFLPMSLVEMGALSIGWRGPILPRNVDEILTRSFHATSDFPLSFENAMNKVMLARYQVALPTYRQIAAERTFNDFRPHNMYRTGDFPTLLPLTETGEIKHGTTGESKETVSVIPYGRIFSVTRQAIVNDDLGVIDEIIASAGDVVLRFENNTFFAMFNSNPKLATDNVAVFATAHANLNSPGFAPSVQTISNARKAFRVQKGLNSEFLNIPPSILLVGPAQETIAEQMTTTIQPVIVGAINPFAGKLRVVVDANITDNSWYLLAEPGSLPNFVYGFLAGGYGPRMRTDEPFGYQGVRWSLELDFGCGAIDYRGGYRDEGSGVSGG